MVSLTENRKQGGKRKSEEGSMSCFLHPRTEGRNKDGSDLVERGAEEEGALVIQGPEPLSCLYSQDRVLGGREGRTQVGWPGGRN